MSNLYTAKKDHTVKGVGFYVAQEKTNFVLELKKSLNEAPWFSINGRNDLPGFYYLNLAESKLKWAKGERLFVVLTFDNQAYAYDASSTIDILLNGHRGGHQPISTYWNTPVLVNSKALKNESFYLTGKESKSWKDFSSFIYQFLNF